MDELVGFAVERLPVDVDAPAIRLAELGQQVQKCGFACSASTDDGGHLARVDRQVDVVQQEDLGVYLILEADVLKSNRNLLDALIVEVLVVTLKDLFA